MIFYTIIETLNGLADFYVQNPNVKIGLFLISFDGHDIIDKYKLETDFSKYIVTFQIFVRFFKYIYLISGIKKVSHLTEKPQEPRKYAILGALSSIQTL